MLGGAPSQARLLTFLASWWTEEELLIPHPVPLEVIIMVRTLVAEGLGLEAMGADAVEVEGEATVAEEEEVVDVELGIGLQQDLTAGNCIVVSRSYVLTISHSRTAELNRFV